MGVGEGRQVRPETLDRNHRIVSTAHGFAIQERCEKSTSNKSGWESIRWYGSLGEVGEGYLRLSTRRSRLTLPQACLTAVNRLSRASARFSEAARAYEESLNAE